MSKQQKDVHLHAVMCLIGGYAGTYTLLRCHENFGAAQTANLIFALRVLFGGDIAEFLLRLLGLAVYMGAIEAYVLIRRRTRWDIRKWVIMTQIVCLAIMGTIPAKGNLFLCLYPSFFMMAAQWSVFHGTAEYNASTIFSSNNVRQFALAIGEYSIGKNRTQASKIKFYGMTLLSYHTGAAAVIIAYPYLSQYAIFLCYIPVILAAVLVFLPERRHRTSMPGSHIRMGMAKPWLHGNI